VTIQLSYFLDYTLALDVGGHHIHGITLPCCHRSNPNLVTSNLNGSNMLPSSDTVSLKFY
jgi:hypothetical protein